MKVCLIDLGAIRAKIARNLHAAGCSLFLEDFSLSFDCVEDEIPHILSQSIVRCTPATPDSASDSTSRKDTPNPEAPSLQHHVSARLAHS